MSARNNPDSTAALEINTRVHEPGTTPEDPWVSVKQLTKEQMNSVPSATKSKNSSTMRQPSTDHKIFRALLDRGTAIHKEVEREINGPGKEPKDPDFRAETSLLDSKLERYGAKDTKRIDVLENTRKEATVCIHDGKTGKRPLTFSEMRKLVAAAHSFYPGTKRVIITEVRPSE